MRIFFCLFLLIPLGLRAANPSFSDFNANQFGVTGNKVVIKSGALTTNLIVSGTLTADNMSFGTFSTPELDVGLLVSTNGIALTDTLFSNLGTPLVGQFPIKYSSDYPIVGPGFVHWDNSSQTWIKWLRSTNAMIVYTNSAFVTPGLTLTNSTVAALGAQKPSPGLYLSGNGWSTTSSASMPVAYRISVTPSQGATTPSSTFAIDSSLNNATYVGAFSMTPAGAVTIGGSINIGATGNLLWAGKSFFSSSADGAIETRNNGGSARSTIQFNQPQITKTANYVIVALDSGLRFVNIGAAATNRLDLPTAAAGMHFWFYEDAAFDMRVQATGTDVIRDGATVSPAAGGITLNAVGTTLHIFSPKALLWVVDQKNGTLLGPN